MWLPRDNPSIRVVISQTLFQNFFFLILHIPTDASFLNEDINKLLPKSIDITHNSTKILS